DAEPFVVESVDVDQITAATMPGTAGRRHAGHIAAVEQQLPELFRPVGAGQAAADSDDRDRHGGGLGWAHRMRESTSCSISGWSYTAVTGTSRPLMSSSRAVSRASCAEPRPRSAKGAVVLIVDGSAASISAIVATVV